MSGIHVIVSHVVGVLGPTLAAVAIREPDVARVKEWAAGEGYPNFESTIRAIEASRAIDTIGDYGHGLSRAWLLGCNPMLGDDSPVNALHEGKLLEVRAAARTFAEDGWA